MDKNFPTELAEKVKGYLESSPSVFEILQGGIKEDDGAAELLGKMVEARETGSEGTIKEPPGPIGV